MGVFRTPLLFRIKINKHRCAVRSNKSKRSMQWYKPRIQKGIRVHMPYARCEPPPWPYKGKLDDRDFELTIYGTYIHKHKKQKKTTYLLNSLTLHKYIRNSSLVGIY